MTDHEHETGRYLVALGRGPVQASLRELRRMGARDVATSSDFTTAARTGGSVLLERLGVAVLESWEPGADLSPASSPALSPGLSPAVEPERWVRVPEPRLAAGTGSTWGLQALGPGSGLTGAGVRVAVLDTGVDLDHPDLAARLAGTTSLVPGEGVDDVQGHGTHCAGTVCGDPSYGVAPGVSLCCAKVLGDDGRGREADVLAGVEWAVEQGCRVVSMSLGSPGDGGFSQVFEQVAAELLDDGVVLVAASGNDGASVVGRPASCPSVVSVGAVGRDLRVAGFSNRGPGLDLVAPGVEVLSAWPGGGTRVLDGTSMATPHVAGVLALLLEQHPELGGRDLVSRLLRACRPVEGPVQARGAGLVQRP